MLRLTDRAGWVQTSHMNQLVDFTISYSGSDALFHSSGKYQGCHGQGKSLENEFFSRLGKSQGI